MTKTPKIGNQNPTQSIILPYRTSRYRDAIVLYEKAQRTAQPWQVQLLKHILAINADGLWTHTKSESSAWRSSLFNLLMVLIC
ncbi:hypothetical protein O6R05_06090 [Peptoniphilus equinus]|uniref:Uncharacterized protein n=1 Tax=Peptoniphilus equinus TaxID=3016343 RepID=A0ABY7QRZ4_9FIRM|nr:hypothetical protein [Peptoniphilus equinus]WBW49564.1 hypothetical protein O6R05_06090 [Peptoniphilus equinus]